MTDMPVGLAACLLTPGLVAVDDAAARLLQAKQRTAARQLERDLLSGIPGTSRQEVSAASLLVAASQS